MLDYMYVSLQGDDKLVRFAGVEILRASKVLTEKVIASLHAKQAGVL